jgi:hypothetical protein
VSFAHSLFVGYRDTKAAAIDAIRTSLHGGKLKKDKVRFCFLVRLVDLNSMQIVCLFRRANRKSQRKMMMTMMMMTMLASRVMMTTATIKQPSRHQVRTRIVVDVEK